MLVYRQYLVHPFISFSFFSCSHKLFFEQHLTGGIDVENDTVLSLVPLLQWMSFQQRRPDAGAEEIVKTTTAAIGSVDTDSNMVGSGIADKDHIDA
jgi:hypothetical protein